MDIIEQYEDYIKGLARKYSFLGYDDIYNECVMYLLDGHSKGIKGLKDYVSNRVRKYVKAECQFRGLERLEEWKY